MRIFFDVNSQRDFLESGRPMTVKDNLKIKEAIKTLTWIAKENNIRLLGSVDFHKTIDNEFLKFPVHCVGCSEGARHIEEDYLKLNVMNYIHKTEYDNKFMLSLINKKIPLYFVKDDINVFHNPNIEKTLEILKVKEAIVYGVSTEYDLKTTVEELIDHDIKVKVVLTAIGGYKEDKINEALIDMDRRGVKFINLQEV